MSAAHKFQSTQKQGKSMSQVFWLRIMNDIIRPRFLKAKQKQQNQCLQAQTFQKYFQCYQRQANGLERDTIEMQFFSKKFDTCIHEGVKALYPLKRVQDICSNKLINIIKEQTSLRRQKEKETNPPQQTILNKKANNQNQKADTSLMVGNLSKQIKKENDSNVQKKQNPLKFHPSHKLSWQQQKSLEKMDVKF